jgi:pSer/pThr/pTyr-binding forkhead associated (FHA) protein
MNDLPKIPSPDSEVVEIPTIDLSSSMEDFGVVPEAVASDDHSPIRAIKISGSNGIRTRLERGGKMCVGRSDEADIMVQNDLKLSRQHLVFECSSSQALVRDLGSLNGTFVNGRKVQVLRLRNHDQVIAGATVFTIQIEYE